MLCCVVCSICSCTSAVVFLDSICQSFYYELQEKETKIEEGITRESFCFQANKKRSSGKGFVWWVILVFTQDVVAGISRVTIRPIVE